jgi:hypothetical protein
MPNSVNRGESAGRMGLAPRCAAGMAGAGDDRVVVRATRSGRAVRQQEPALALPRGTRLSKAIPVEETVSCELAMPFGRRRKSYRVLPSQLDLRVPFPIEESAYAFAESEVGAETYVVGLAVRDRQMSAVTGGEASGPHVVDSEGLALWDESLETMLPANEGEGRIVLYVTGERLVVVAGRGGRFLGAQVLPLEPGGGFDRFVTAHFGVLRTADWLAHVAGPGAASAREPLEALVARNGGRYVEADDSGVFLARALARRALGRGRYLCNLRSGRWAHPAVVAARVRALRTATVLFGVAALIVGGASVFWSVRLLDQQRRFEGQLALRAEGVAGGLVTLRGEDMMRQLSRSVVAREAEVREWGRLNGPGCEPLLAPLSSEAAALGIELRGIAAKEGVLSIELVTDEGAALPGLRGWLSARGVSDIEVVERSPALEGDRIKLTGRLP